VPQFDIDAQLRSLLADAVEHERLPPERDLAMRFRVSRAAVRRALGALEAEGCVRRHVGQGTFVLPRGPAPETEPASLISVTNPSEVMEVRVALEPRIAALAAMHASARDVADMERILAKSREAPSREAFEEWDSALHEAIARSCRNSLMVTLFGYVNAVRGEVLWGQLKKKSLTRERQNDYCDDHEAVVRAIRDRDMAVAERAMRIHVERVQRHILAPLAGTVDNDPFPFSK
jgi:DNA-binding FadR family transcriptional regulator